jgi:hypothetical protein
MPKRPSYVRLLLPRAVKIASERLSRVLDDIGLTYEIESYLETPYEKTFKILVEGFVVNSIHIGTCYDTTERFKDKSFYPDLTVDPLELLALQPDVFHGYLPCDYEEIMGESREAFLEGLVDRGDTPLLSEDMYHKLLEWESKFNAMPTPYSGSIDVNYFKNLKTAEPFIRDEIKLAKAYNIVTGHKTAEEI